MNMLEIVLLIIGGIIFILSFVVPVKQAEVREGTKELVKDEVKVLVEEELKSVKDRIEDIVEETVSYTIEKTERSLERISNEKIMAVNEYSDTVLEEINKNHKEVMFLYDMLNSKHDNIKETVNVVGKTVKEAEAVIKTTQETEKYEKPVVKSAAKKTIKKVVDKEDTENQHIEVPAPDLSFMTSSKENGLNSNNRILELHNAGKSNVAIAKELGLGIGEVRLVIDLFEGV